MNSKFELFLTNLKESQQVRQMQLSASAIALDRCREAIEWQLALLNSANILTKRSGDALEKLVTEVDQIYKYNQASISKKNASQYAELALQAQGILDELIRMKGEQQEFHGNLNRVAKDVTDLEQITLSLAMRIEAIEQRQAIFKDLLQHKE